MKKFKGLIIPEKQHNDVSKIQEQYCNNASGNCFGVRCSKCLFGSNNLEKFTEWFNNQNK